MQLRMRDYLPVRSKDAEEFIQAHFPVQNCVSSGAASNFLRFVSRELMPWVDVEYRTDVTNRTLIGHSWGGTFALYALFSEPHLFQNYLVLGPDLPYGDDLILRMEEAFATTSSDLPVRLYLANGEYEIDDSNEPALRRFANALEGRRYPGLGFTEKVIAGTTHCSSVAPAIQAGLVWLLGHR